MTNRNVLLGRSKPSEKLTRVECGWASVSVGVAQQVSQQLPVVAIHPVDQPLRHRSHVFSQFPNVLPDDSEKPTDPAHEEGYYRHQRAAHRGDSLPLYHRSLPETQLSNNSSVPAGDLTPAQGRLIDLADTLAKDSKGAFLGFVGAQLGGVPGPSQGL